MQMGHMRFEPNINVHITDEQGVVHKTAITEIKNLNSFSVLERATRYEIQRQIHEWENTGSLGRKSTYGWDESTECTFHQRDKEDAHDYRYFPDPDLVPVEVSDAWLEELKAQVGESPTARRKRYVEALGLSPADAATLASDRSIGDFYERAIANKAKPQRVANLILGHGLRLAKEHNAPLATLGIDPARFEEVATMIDADQLAASAAGPVFDRLLQEPGKGAGVIARELGLIQTNDAGPIDAAIDALIAENSKSLQDYRAGKQAAFGALMGTVMKSAKGLNPKLVQQRLKERLSS
jgi:aspartyl-tRNA(Asn)/glutamyl-tRNA(Gln) amidotransferase subunit B